MKKHTGAIIGCKGDLSLDSNTLSVDCSKCEGRQEIWQKECFLGLSGRLIPGFHGQLVLKGKIDRSYEGEIVEVISSYSQIITDIRNIEGETMKPRLTGIVRDMEMDLASDPIRIVERKTAYLNRIRKALRSKEPPEAERFLSIVEATQRMVRQLERTTSSR